MAQKITTFLWFDTNCEEAINCYVKVFNEAPHSRKNSKVNSFSAMRRASRRPVLPRWKARC
jgi:predicted 3-demethylubiquinone-9 3-methyltransferase (glyoxalase superfamily)